MRIIYRSVVIASIGLAGVRCSGDHADEPVTSTTSSDLSYPPNLVLPLEGQVGSLPGTGSVAPDGSYHYDLPIEVPPGRRGMAPRLSLSYTSRTGNGLLGVGWELSGISAIRRCSQTIAFDGVAAPVQYNSSDDLCWQGHHIVSAPSGLRLDDDNSTNILHPDGDTYVFQQKDGTQVVFSDLVGPEGVFDYLLTKQTDADGNSIDYSYDVVNSGEYYPKAITYTNRTGEPGLRAIHFGYGRSSRPDPLLAYYRGNTFMTNRLLTTIECDAPNPSTPSLVSLYTLSYDQSATGRSRLRAVDRTGADGDPEVERTFAWQSTAFSDYDPLAQQNALNVSHTQIPVQDGEIYRAFDVDGDGRDELFAQIGVSGVLMGYTTPGNGWYQLIANQRLLADPISLVDASFGDLDGDGKVDAIVPVFPNKGSGDYITSHYQLAQWSGTAATGSFAYSTDFGPYYYATDQYGTVQGTPGSVNVIALADLDGDGLVDMVHGVHTNENEVAEPGNEPFYPAYIDYHWTYSPNTSTPGSPISFGAATDIPFATSGVQSPLAGGSHPTFTSNRGGGRQGLYFANTWDTDNTTTRLACLIQPYAGVASDPGTGLVPLTSSSARPQSAYADLNGDGEPDFVHYDVAGQQICVSWGGAPEGVPATCATVANADTTHTTIPEDDTCMPPTPAQTVGPWHLMAYDMDGDGRDDIVLAHDDDGSAYELQSFRVWFDATNTLNVHPLEYKPRAVGDFDGDGRLEAVLSLPPIYYQASIVRAPYPTEDVLTSVGDRSASSTNIRETVGYTQQWWPSKTTWPSGDGAMWAVTSQGAQPALPTCAYPQQCLRTGIEVVFARQITTGDDAQHAIQSEYYSYADPRADVQGRGFLGFGVVDRFNLTTLRDEVTQYERLGGLQHVVPEQQWVMTPIQNEQLAPPGTTATSPIPTYNPGATTRARISRTRYQYDFCGSLDVPYSEPECANQVQTDEWEETLSYDPSNATAAHLWGPNGAPAPSDPGATLLRTRFATMAHDAYGNITNQTTWTQGGLQSAVSTTYQAPDLASWLVARPKSVTSTLGCADAGCTSSSDGTLTPAPRRTDFSYTGADLTKIVVEPTSSDPAIQETIAIGRNSDGSVTSIARSTPNQSARTDTYTYDAAERIFVTAHTNALSQTEQMLYHPGYGALVAEADPNGVVTSFQIDELGHRRSVIPAGAATLHYSFLPRVIGAQLSGTIATITGTDGSWHQLQSDLLGHVVSDSHVGFAGVAIVRDFQYDAEGRQIAATRPGYGTPGSAETTQLYDSLDRPYVHVDAAGGTTTYAQSFASTSIVDPAGHFTSVTRDVDDRTIQSVQLAPDGSQLKTSYRYGDFDELARIIDPNGNAIRSTYDQRGRRVSTTNPDTGTSSTTYDGFDNITSTTEGTSATSYTRDVLGRSIQIANADGTAYLTWDGTNGIGKPATQQSADGNSHLFFYDTAGREYQDVYLAGNSQILQFKRTFDASGRVASLLYPSIYGTSVGLTVGYNYNAHGYLASIDRTDSGSTTVYWTTQSTTVDDVPDSVLFGNGITGTRTFDPAGRESEIKDPGLVDLKYTYNAESRIATQSDLMVSRTDTYGYDELHRVTQWTAAPTGASTRAMTYAYDNLGNLLTEKLGASTIATYIYGVGAGPHAVTYATSVGGAVGYDARGRELATPTRHVTYTERDLPKTVTVGTTSASFQYDVSGSRIWRADSDGSWTASIDGLFERRSDSNGITDYFYVRGPEGAVAQASLNESTQGRGLAYIHHDVRGTPVATSNASGNLVRRFFFDPWGHRTDQNAVPATDTEATMLFGLDELRYDDDLGLVDQRGRAYDPSLRHFLSADPLVSNAFDGQAYNRYSYIGNDALNRRDPSGFDDEEGDDDDDEEGDPEGSTSLVSWPGNGPMNIPFAPSGGGGGASTAPPPPPVTAAQKPSATPTPSTSGGSASGVHHTVVIYGSGNMCMANGDYARDPTCDTGPQEASPGDSSGVVDFLKRAARGTLVTRMAVKMADAYDRGQNAPRGTKLSDTYSIIEPRMPVLDALVAGGREYLDDYLTKGLAGPAKLGAGMAMDRWTRSPTLNDQGTVWGRTDGICPGCKNVMTREPGPYQFNLDHPHPYASHGPIDPLDAQGLCRTCNNEKGGMQFSEWLDMLKDTVDL